MPHAGTSERGTHDRLAILGGRQELIGWALLGLWAAMWLLRGLPAQLVPSRMEAIAHIDLVGRGTASQVQQDFDAARSRTGAEATLTLLTGKEIHTTSTFVLHVLADTSAHALDQRTAMVVAMEATAPEATRPFQVEAHPSDAVAKVWNAGMKRVALVTTAVLVLFGSGAQILILLGASKQPGVSRVTLWMKLAGPFLFLLGDGLMGGTRNYGGPQLGRQSLSDWLAPIVTFALPLLAIAVIPAMFILWLTRTRRTETTPAEGPRAGTTRRP